MQSRHYEPLPSPSSALKAMAAILTRQAKVDKPRLRNWPDLNRTHVRIILSIMLEILRSVGYSGVGKYRKKLYAKGHGVLF